MLAISLASISLVLVPSPRCVVRMDAATTITAEGWTALMPELEQVPIFVLTNAAGQPLSYERDGKPLAPYYADLVQAKMELEQRRRELPELDLRILPIGLGSAFMRASTGSAMLVPSSTELDNAADPEADTPYEAGLPLFACLAMRKPHANRDGVQAMPLFMCAADAQASRDTAAAAAPPDTQSLELLVIPLLRALERMVDQPGDDGLIFEIVPPADSVAWVRSFLESPPPPPSRGVGRAPEPDAGPGAGIFPE